MGDTETNVLLRQEPKSIQSTASIDVESQEKVKAKANEERGLWDRIFGADPEDEAEAQRLEWDESADLTPQEYLDIQQKLIASRKNMKSQSARLKTQHDEAQTSLLRTYQKFHKFVQEQDDEPWGHLGEKDIGERLLEKIRFTENEENQGKELDDDAKKTRNDHLKELRQEIERNSHALETYKNQLTAQMKNNLVFLNDQGRVLAVVEKATAQQENSQMGQDVKRSQMYKTIVKAIYDSPALDALDPEEAEKERNDILEILRQLELVETKTDELIQRVVLKLRAIQQEETNQLGQIEEQVNTQEQVNRDLDELTNQITRNNESVKNSTHELRDKILGNLESIKKAGKLQLVSYCLLAIVILCGGIALYFTYTQVKKL